MAIPTLEQLKQALHIGEQIEKLKAEMASIFGEKIPQAVKSAGTKVASFISGRKRKKPKFSKAARARIAAAQKARWAKVKSSRVASKTVAAAKAKPKTKKKGKMSAAGRANIIAAQKKRWAAVKAEKEKKA